MSRVVLRRVEIDRCPDCQGTWLDSSELATLVGSWSDLPRTGVVLELSGEPPCCPRCHCGLEHRTYSNARRTLVDRCPCCSGIWLDRGELDMILSEIYGG
jgi:Zn-finger nucleic acid-binding protein